MIDCISWLSEKQSDFDLVGLLDGNTIGIKKHYKTSIRLTLSIRYIYGIKRYKEITVLTECVTGGYKVVQVKNVSIH